MSEYDAEPAPSVSPALHDVVPPAGAVVVTLFMTKAPDVPFQTAITDSNTPAVTVVDACETLRRYM